MSGASVAEGSDGIDVLTVGETMTAVRCAGPLRLGGPAQITVAGAESNLAIGLARLGHRAAWSGRLGPDESAELILRTLRAEGVDTSTVARDPEAGTGLLLFERRLADLTRVEYHRAGSAGSRWNAGDIEPALALRPRIVHVTGITAALSGAAREALSDLVAGARGQGALVSVDVNFRGRLWSRDQARPMLRDLARRADVVIASEDELELVAAEPEELLEAGVGEVVTKRGAAGASALTREGEVSVPARRVQVVDTIGAGDAFSAGYLSGVLDGCEVDQRLARGATLGAFAVASAGDWEGLPTREELALLDVDEGESIR
ncbi:sugar kinase [Nesterenkonia alba]|uniref:sugar kinase n=1 Tax=Nesterenkonia alba TaxID=515814 RepID=UPI001FDEF48B|nr:sugar kinase [Nesterenkonia alba]